MKERRQEFLWYQFSLKILSFIKSLVFGKIKVLQKQDHCEVVILVKLLSMFQLISNLSLRLSLELSMVRVMTHEGIGGAEHNVVRVTREAEHNYHKIFNDHQELWTEVSK
jgi:hypothetical protein